jgi:hypothetical protein
MDSFFDKLNSTEGNGNVEAEYPFETDIVESELSTQFLESIPLKSSTGQQAIYVPLGCVQTFEDIDEVCTLRFHSTSDNEQIDGSVIVLPLEPGSVTNIFGKETVEELILQMTEDDPEADDYEVNEISKVVKGQNKGVFLDFSVLYGNSAVRNLLYATLKNDNLVMAVVTIPQQMSEQLGSRAFTSAVTLTV